MTYETFKETLKQCILIDLAEKDLLGEVTFGTALKLNHRPEEKINVKLTGKRMEPSISVDQLYKLYQQGVQLPALSNWIIKVADLPEQPAVEWSKKIEDYQQAREHLHVRVYGKERNQDFLEKIPLQEKADLMLVCYVELQTETELQSTLVDNRMLERWGISKEQLFTDALESSKRIAPVQVGEVGKMIGVEELPNDIPPLTVITNPQRQFGASALFYPHVLEQMAETRGNFYILPSSVHEVLIIPEIAGISLDELESTVQEVNKLEVGYEDFLSDHVYHYDELEHKFERADVYEARQAMKSEQDHAKNKRSITEKLSETMPKPERHSPKKDHTQEL